MHARDKRGHAQIVRHIGIRSGTKQEIGGLEIVPVRRPHERGRAVGRSYVDVDLLIQQRTDGTLITMSGRLDQPRIAVCRGTAATTSETGRAADRLMRRVRSPS